MHSNTALCLPTYPPPFCNLPPIATPPIPGRPSLPCFSSQHPLRWFVLPICFTHGLVLLSHYFKSITSVYSVTFSLQRRCMGVLCCYLRPTMFSPGDCVRYHSHTLGAHVLATFVRPSPNEPQFCHIRYIRPGGVTPVDHASAQLSRLEAVAGGRCAPQVFGRRQRGFGLASTGVEDPLAKQHFHRFLTNGPCSSMFSFQCCPPPPLFFLDNDACVCVFSADKTSQYNPHGAGVHAIQHFAGSTGLGGRTLSS